MSTLALPMEMWLKVAWHASSDVASLKALSMTIRGLVHECQQHIFSTLTVTDDTQSHISDDALDPAQYGSGKPMPDVVQKYHFLRAHLNSQSSFLRHVKHLRLVFNGAFDNTGNMPHFPYLGLLIENLQRFSSLASVHISRAESLDNGPFGFLGTNHLIDRGASHMLASLISSSATITELTVSNVALDLWHMSGNTLPTSLRKLVLHRAALQSDGNFYEQDFEHDSSSPPPAPVSIEELELSDGLGFLDGTHLIYDLFFRFVDVSALEKLKIPLVWVSEQEDPLFLHYLHKLIRKAAPTLKELTLLSVDEECGEIPLSAELNLKRLRGLDKLVYRCNFVGLLASACDELPNILELYIDYPELTPSLLQLEVAVDVADVEQWACIASELKYINNHSLCLLRDATSGIFRSLAIQVKLDFITPSGCTEEDKVNLAALINDALPSLWTQGMTNGNCLRIDFVDPDPRGISSSSTELAYLESRDGENLRFGHADGSQSVVPFPEPNLDEFGFSLISDD